MRLHSRWSANRAVASKPRAGYWRIRIPGSQPSRGLDSHGTSQGFGGLHKPVDLARGLGAAFLAMALASSALGQNSVTLAWDPDHCPAVFTGLCVLGGIVPALKAYRVPVAETIAPVS